MAASSHWSWRPRPDARLEKVFARKVACTARVTDIEVVVVDRNGERQSVEVSQFR